MLVANSFDLWQRDTFFSAAEEVQHSADIMESAYRTWLRESKEGMRPQIWDDLSRELQMALGTAKWQLEEFEKAVTLSYRRSSDEVTMTRHRQFVSAIENQISRVEAALSESFDVDGKQSLRWVNLDEKERDDLALFLSGPLWSSQSMSDGADKLGTNKTGSPQKRTRKNFNTNADIGVEGEKPNTASSRCIVDLGSVVELDMKGSPGTGDSMSHQQDMMLNAERIRSSLDSSKLEIVIDHRDGQMETKALNIEATPKEKGFKPAFWRPKGEDHPQAKGGVLSNSMWRRIQWMNQLFGRLPRIQRQSQTHQMMPFNCSIRFTLVFMLAVFLIVPFLFYSN
ncbi:uncharacterized protein [Coffea arabica]|uniref:Syntaxin 6/10/61 N-terminal domain-containing protein n=1 Tax=Coffea arabica TaxID=13443 RepID=A0A6P6SYT1_COFAR|nr:uncharacterized protein LOC113695945 [Coffea arabica]